jgi:hypothetical protein
MHMQASRGRSSIHAIGFPQHARAHVSGMMSGASVLSLLQHHWVHWRTGHCGCRAGSSDFMFAVAGSGAVLAQTNGYVVANN